MRRGALLFSIAAALIVAPAYAASTSNTVNVPKAYSRQIASIKKTSKVPVILPTTLPFGGKVPKIYAVGGGSKTEWTLVLTGAPNCGGADACFLASFSGTKGGKLPARSNVKVAGAQSAFFKDVTCGASCSPASIWFVYHGVLYNYEHKDAPKNTKTVLTRMAAQAIAAGPR